MDVMGPGFDCDSFAVISRVVSDCDTVILVSS